MSLPFDPAPSRLVPSLGAESGHKEGTRFESSSAATAAESEGMSGRAQKVLDEALDLSDEERAEVAFELVASLDGPADSVRKRRGPPSEIERSGDCADSPRRISGHRHGTLRGPATNRRTVIAPIVVL